MMNQPDNLAGVLEPAPDNINQLSVSRRLSPIPENSTDVWYNLSYDIQRILDKAESGDDDWDQFSKDIQRTLEVLDIRDNTGDLNNWLSLQDIRTPHTNQYGWQSCEFNVLTKNQKKAVHLAHLHLDMIKEDSERLQIEGHLSNYKLYIDMVRLWLYSIRKFGQIDCGMALNNIEKIVDDYGAIAMNNLEERKDIWFLTKKLISTLEADSTAIQIINTKEIEEMSQLTTEIVQVKLFLRQDNPSSLDSLISHLSLTDSVDQYMDSNFSGFKPSKRNIKDYILQPVPNTFKLIRTVTQNKVNVEWSGAASNLIRLQNIGTKSRVNEIPILTPNTTPGLELTWTHTLYSCKEDNISLAPWLRERAKDHLYTITGNVYIGKRLNKNVQPDAEIIAATMENPQDSRPTHYISIDFSSYIGREVQRLKQYLISMDGQLAQYDGGPCHLTLLAFQMPLGGYNMVKDSFEHFGREVSKIAKSRMLIKAGKIKILEPGNITIDIIGGKLEQLNRILVNIFQENGMRVDLKFSPHATLFKFNHKLQRGPDTKAAMRVIANPAWEIVDKLHIYPMGKKNRIPWFTMKFSIELGWEVTENDTCNPAKPFYNEEDDSGPDEDQRGGLITSQQPLSNVNQPQARVSTPPCQTQPSSANDTSKHSRIALPLSGRQMRQKAAQNLIHSTMDKNLALKPCSHVTQYSSDGLSAPPRNIISNGYEAQITDADNCKTVNQMEQLHGCKTNMTKDVELIRPHTPLINTGCQSPVTCGHNPNCMMINKEAQNDDIPITLTYTQGKPGEESQDYYLNTTGEIIPSLHIHPHLGDTDIISYFPELAPWDDEDKSIVGLVKTDDVENKPFDIKHIQEEHQVLRAFLFPQLDPYSRCMDCLSCHCAPDVLFKSKDLQDSTKEQDNAVIFESIKPIQLEDGSIRFITKYPVDYQLLNTYFLNTNRRQVLMELDRKLKKLSPLQAASSQQEFSKLVGLGFLIPWSQMPHKVQTLIKSHAYQHYICASPAFKEDSLSTSTRIAFNASSKNTQGKSLNSLMPTGRFKMDLASSFRHFRYHNVGMHADLSKYFNRIFLSSQSMHLSRLIWRQDCSLANPPGEYIMSRLFYGMKSSTSICSAALCYISAFVQRKCTGSCKIGTPCTGIQCELVKLISKIYVDDIFHSTITIQRAMRLKQYCIKVFGIFGFQFKDFLISGENDEKSPMLKDGTCSLGGYNWRPLDDMIKVKTPKLSNGKKFRNSIIQSSSFSYIDTQGQRKTIQPPPLIVKTFDQDETISLEAISNIFEGVPKTIRFLLSKGGLCYDPHGLIMPLGNQLRYITSRIIKKWGLYYEQEISEQEYTRWLKSFHQFILGSKLWFSRKMNAKKAATHGKTYLVGVSDYGQMVNSSLYIVHQLQDGTFQTTHLAGAGMLLDASAPRGELQGVSIISQMVNCVRQELVNFIDFVVVATDSMISIFWCQKNPQDLKPYIKKRVENIQRHINPRTELYHCKTAYLSADIGTKFGSELHGEPLITAEVVEEGSLYKTGFGWMNDIPGAVEARIITPAEVAIKNHNGIILPDKERRSYLSGFRWSNFTKLQSHSLESVIQADTTIMQGSVLPADIAVSCVEDPQELQNEGSETIKDVSKISQMFAPSGADQDAVIEDEFLAAYFLTSNYDIDSSINMSGEHNTMYATSVVDPCILAPLVVDGDIDVTHRMASAPDSIAEHDNSALDVTHRMISAPDSLAENDDKVCLPFENIDSLTISNSKDCSSVPIPKPHLDPDFLAHLENKLYFNNKYYTLGFEELTPGDDDHIAIVNDDALANHSNDADDTALVLITSTADSPPDSIGASFVPGLTEGNLEGPSLVNLNHPPHESNNSKQQPETIHFENGNSFCINVEPTSHLVPDDSVKLSTSDEGPVLHHAPHLDFPQENLEPETSVKFKVESGSSLCENTVYKQKPTIIPVQKNNKEHEPQDVCPAVQHPLHPGQVEHSVQVTSPGALITLGDVVNSSLTDITDHGKDTPVHDTLRNDDSAEFKVTHNNTIAPEDVLNSALIDVIEHEEDTLVPDTLEKKKDDSGKLKIIPDNILADPHTVHKHANNDGRVILENIPLQDQVHSLTGGAHGEQTSGNKELKITEVASNMKSIIQKMESRYNITGRNVAHGIDNIKYLMPFSHIIRTPFDKVCVIHKLVILACIKFKSKVSTSPLMLEQGYSTLLDSIVNEMPSFTHFKKSLPDYAVVKLHHQNNFLKRSPYLDYSSKFMELEGYSATANLRKEDFLTLTPSNNNPGNGGYFLDHFRYHPLGKVIVRICSLLFCITSNISERNNCVKDLTWIWRLIQILLKKVTFQHYHTSSMSIPVLHDIVLVLKKLAEGEYWTQLLQISTSYKKDLSQKLLSLENQNPLNRNPKEIEILRETINFYVTPNMFSNTNTPVLLVESPLLVSDIICDKYVRAYQAVATLFAIRVSSEVDQCSSKTQKSNHCINIKGFLFCKSRFSSYVETCGDSDLVSQLLKESGFNSHNLIIDTYSPVVTCLFNFHHQGRGTSLKIRKTLAHQHLGRDATILNLSKSKSLLAANKIVASLIMDCWFCALRLKKFSTFPQGKIHSHNVVTNPNSTFLSCHCDIAGPVKLRLSTGPATRNQPEMKVYILVCVCSITKATILAFAESRKLVHIAQAMRAVSARVPTPLVWIFDNESAVRQLVGSGEGKMAVTEEGWGHIEDFKIVFVPPTSKGHQSNSSAESKIKILRTILGNFDFTELGATPIGAYNILFMVEEIINSIPLALRNAGTRNNFFHMSPALMFISPGMFLGIPNRRKPSGPIHLNSNVENSLNLQAKTIDTLNRFMKDYLVHIQKNAKLTFDGNQGTVGRGDIVALMVNPNVFHMSLSDWRYGIVTKVLYSEFDKRARIIQLRYCNVPGDQIDRKVIQNQHIILTRRRLDQIVKLADYGSLYLEQDYARNANYIEKLLNNGFGLTKIEDSTIPENSTTHLNVDLVTTTHPNVDLVTHLVVPGRNTGQRASCLQLSSSGKSIQETPPPNKSNPTTSSHLTPQEEELTEMEERPDSPLSPTETTTTPEKKCIRKRIKERWILACVCCEEPQLCLLAAAAGMKMVTGKQIILQYLIFSLIRVITHIGSQKQPLIAPTKLAPGSDIEFNWLGIQPLQTDLQQTWNSTDKFKRDIRKRCSIIRVSNNTEGEHNNGHYRLLNNIAPWHRQKLIYFNLLIGKKQRFFMMDKHFSWNIKSELIHHSLFDTGSRLVRLSFFDKMGLERKNKSHTGKSYVRNQRQAIPSPSFARISCLNFDIQPLDYFTITSNIAHWTRARESTISSVGHWTKTKVNTSKELILPPLNTSSKATKQPNPHAQPSASGSDNSVNITGDNPAHNLSQKKNTILTANENPIHLPPLQIEPQLSQMELRTDNPKDERKVRLIHSGNTVQMNCSGPNVKNAPLIWSRTNGQVPTSAIIQNRTLTLHDVQDSDNGIYSCQLQLKDRILTVNTFHLKIKQSTVQKISLNEKYKNLYTGYNCSDEQSQMVLVDSTSNLICEQKMFAAYSPMGQKDMAIIVQSDYIESEVITCTLGYRVRVANCGQGFGGYSIYSHSNGFRDNNVEYLEISKQDCLQAYEKGILMFTLGSESFEVRFKVSDNVLIAVDHFLGNSAFPPSQICIGSDQRSVYRNRNDQFSDGRGMLFHLLGTLEVKKQKAVIELSKPPMILVPSIGLQFTFNGDKRFSHSTVKHMIIAAKPGEIHNLSQFTLYNQGKMSKYQGTTNLYVYEELLQNHNYTLGFSEGPVTMVGQVACLGTQFKNILLCPAKDTRHLPLPPSPEQTKSNILNSGLAILNLRVDKSISAILYHTCLLQNKLQQHILSDTNKLGLLIFPERGLQGTSVISRGELSVVFSCHLTIVEADPRPKKYCCKNLHLLSKETEQIYLTPITRKITNQCLVQACSDFSRLTMFDLEGKAMCSTKQGLTACKETFLKLNNSGLQSSIFEPLSHEELMNSGPTREEVKFLFSKLMSTQSKSQILMQTIDRNSAFCKGNIRCLDAYKVDQVTKIELQRALYSSFYSFWPFSPDQNLIEKFIIFTLLGWISWILLKAIFDFLLLEMWTLKQHGLSCKAISQTFWNANITFNPLYQKTGESILQQHHRFTSMKENQKMQEKRLNILRTYTYETIQARIQRLETVMGFHSPGGTYCHGVGEQEPLLEHASTRQTFPHLYDRPRFARLAPRKPLPRPRSASLPHELTQEQYIEMSSPLDYEPVIQRTSSRKGLSSTLV